MNEKTYSSPNWPCPECGGIQRYFRTRGCVNCPASRERPVERKVKQRVAPVPKPKDAEIVAMLDGGMSVADVAQRTGLTGEEVCKARKRGRMAESMKGKAQYAGDGNWKTAKGKWPENTDFSDKVYL